MGTRHDEARHDPDARIVEVGSGVPPTTMLLRRRRTRFGRGSTAHQPTGVSPSYARSPGHRRRGHLRLEAIAQSLVADRPPVAAGDLVPLAPAVRRVALGAEHRFDVAERRVACVDDARRAGTGESSVGGAFIPSR
jgi:hypothetical protein